MSDSSNPNPDTNSRDALRAKIEANERRIAERTMADEAREAAGAAGRFVKDNPFTVIGGAIALGIAIGLMTRSGRKAAVTAAEGAANAAKGAAVGAVGGTAKTVGTAAKKRSAAFGALLADSIVAYGARLIEEALDTARAGQMAVEDMSESAVKRAREVRRDAEHAAVDAAESARSVGERTRHRATRAVRSVADRLTG
ncbi:MAG: hypothetical protein V2I27_07860 [Erythrobacter sp.]|jgi:ElaB/YqjD/DUF883 family membrane-anchored ribosome-binding protein|nr:hypothetical protein [Erythrobacter sp.]